MRLLNSLIITLAVTTVLFGCSPRHTVDQNYATKAEGVPSIFDLESRHSDTVVKPLPQRPSLDDYLLFALSNSAALQAAYLNYQSALDKAPQVSALPDPVFSYGYFIQETQTRVGPQQHKVGLMQPIPWFGKLGLKESIAGHEAKAFFYAFLSKKNRLASEVISAYFELAYLESATEITEANFELLKRWEQVLTQRYRSQTGTQADLIKVQVELGKLEDRVQELSQLKAPLTAGFNSLLNRESDAEVIIDMKMLSAEPSPLVPSLSQDSLKVEMSKHNPELLLLDALYKSKESGVKLAHKNFLPDFGIGADYIFVGNREGAGPEGGDDSLVAMFSVTLPLYRSKYRAGLSQAEKEKKASLQSKQAKYHELSSQLARAIFEANDSKRRINLFSNTLVPKAEESLESTYTAFETGEATFLELLDSERTILDFELSLTRAQADFHIANATLRSLLGEYSDRENEISGETIR